MLVTDVNRDLEQNEWHFAEEEEKKKEHFFRHKLTKEPNKLVKTLGSIDNNIVELVIINT